jgi:hypothetical protein
LPAHIIWFLLIKLYFFCVTEIVAIKQEVVTLVAGNHVECEDEQGMRFMAADHTVLMRIGYHDLDRISASRNKL